MQSYYIGNKKKYHMLEKLLDELRLSNFFLNESGWLRDFGKIIGEDRKIVFCSPMSV